MISLLKEECVLVLFIFCLQCPFSLITFKTNSPKPKWGRFYFYHYEGNVTKLYSIVFVLFLSYIHEKLKERD